MLATVCADVVCFDNNVLGIEVSGSDGDVHAEFGDVVKRLLALEAVFAAREKFAVVV